MRSRSILVTSLVLPLGLACAKPNTRVELADGERAAPTPSAGASTTPALDDRRPPLDRMQLDAAVAGLDDLLDATEQVYARWVPAEPGAPPLDVQSVIDLGLVQSGFAPNWLAKVNLDGLHLFSLGIPHEGQPNVSDADWQFAATIAARDPTGLVEGLPAEPPAQAIEAGLWQLLAGDELRVLLRARDDALEAATSFELLDALAGRRTAAARNSRQPRLLLSVSDFDGELLDLDPMLDAWGVAAADRPAFIDAARFELAADFGQDRPLSVRASVVGPFSQRFGGPALRDSSALAELLPAGAALVMLQSWGSGTGLADVVDLAAPASPGHELATNVDLVLAKLVGAGHEVALAIYVDRNGQASWVLLADVDDEAKQRAELHDLFVRLGSPRTSSSVSVKLDSQRVGKHKADVLRVELPTNVEGLRWMFGAGKPTFEVAGMVGAGKLVLAAGVGQRELLAKLGPRLDGRKDAGLEASGGLAAARALTDGCQTCVAIDPVAIASGWLAILAADPAADRAFRKRVDEARKRLLGLGLAGQIAVAGRFEADRWDLALLVPASLLFADPDATKWLRETAVEIVDDYRRTTTPSDEAVCRHIMDTVERELGGSGTSPSQDQLDEALRNCITEVAKERAQLGAATFRDQARCVMAADDMDSMVKCEED